MLEKTEYFVVTWYLQANIPQEVSGGAQPAFGTSAADFSRDVCLTVSRNHTMFLLYLDNQTTISSSAWHRLNTHLQSWQSAILVFLTLQCSTDPSVWKVNVALRLLYTLTTEFHAHPSKHNYFKECNLIGHHQYFSTVKIWKAIGRQERNHIYTFVSSWTNWWCPSNWKEA